MKLIKNTKDLIASLKLDCDSDLPIRDFQIDSRKVERTQFFLVLLEARKMEVFMLKMQFRMEHPWSL